MSRFPTAPAWYRPILAGSGAILRRAMPSGQAGAAEQGAVSHSVRHPDWEHKASERLTPRIERGEDRQLPLHIARYAWALPRCEARRVADLGCGAGYGTAILSSLAEQVVGVDVSEEAVGAARQLYPQQRFQVVDLQRGPLPEADVAVCFEVIEHLDQPERALGLFLDAYQRLLLSFPNPIAGGSHLNPHHRVDWPLATLKRKLAQAGARKLEVRRQGYVSPAIRGRRPWPSVSWVIDASR